LRKTTQDIVDNFNNLPFWGTNIVDNTYSYDNSDVDNSNDYIDVDNMWERVLAILKRETMSISFNTFIMPLVPITVEDEFFIVLANDEVAKESVERRYSKIIEKVISEVCNTNFYLKVVLKEDLDQNKTGIIRPKKLVANNSSNLKPKYVFENFIKGKSNELAFAASVAIAEAPGETAYNPLFIYGGVGLGKTHLMHSIGNHILQNENRTKVLYTTSENMTNEFITAIRVHKMPEFRDKYRNVDVLLIDDIQFLSDKEGTQEEFFHTFNELFFANKQIVISSDRPPIELKTLEERLRTRFGSGLIVDITLPDYETRTAILEKKADLERINIPREVLQLISKSISSNIRELEGAFNKITAQAKLTKKQISLELAEQALLDMVNDNVARKITPLLIQEIVGAYYNISKEEIISKKRTATLTYVRHISMFLMRKILDESLVDIGDYHGGRHHSTVVHAVNQVAEQCETSDEFKATLFELENRIRGV